MVQSEGDAVGSSVDYPRFDHGDDLLVLVGGDDTLEFRSESPGEYLKADNAVTVVDLA